MSPQPGLAIFKGTAGTVTVDSVSATGMQFSVDGYTLAGDALWLAGDAATPATIDVGDGTSASEGYKATISNVLTGDVGLNKVDFGTLVLTAANTYTGETDVNGGKLALVGNGSIADSGSVRIYVAGTLDISGTTNGASIDGLGGSGSIVLGDKNLVVSNVSTFEGVISGSGGLTVAKNGFLVLDGQNTYTGLTTVDFDGHLQLGPLDPGAVAGDILDNGTLTFFANDTDQTYGGVISGTGSVAKSGTGMLVLRGANTFTGGLWVIGDEENSSKLAVSSDANLGGTGGAVTLEGGTLEATASFTLAHPLSLVSAPIPVPGTVQVDSGATLTVSNGISGASSDSLIKTGQGTLVLAGMNGYGGSTTISEGTLTLAGSGSLAASSSVIDDGIFDISGRTSGSTIQSLSGSGAVNLGSQRLLLSAASGEFSGVISGSGGLTVSGGTETLTGANTYTLGTVISGGTLKLGNGGTTGSIASDTVTDSGTLVFDQSGPVTYGGAILGPGSVTQAGSGTLTLTGTSTYSGGTNIDSGILQVSTDDNLGACGLGSCGDVLIDNGTLQAGASFTLSHGIDIQNTAHIDTNNYSLILTGPIGWIGQGTLSKEGAGTLTIGSIGPVPDQRMNVEAGTLAMFPGWSYGGVTKVQAGLVSVASGATFDVSQAGGEPEVAGLDGNGTVALGNQRLNIESGSNSWTFGGVLADGGIAGGSGGGVLMNEPGITGTFTGVDTYTGETDILAGTLALADNGSVAGSSGVSIDSGGTLDISATSSGATIQDLWGSGAVVLGARMLTVSGATGILDNGFNGTIGGTGGLELSGGTLLLGGANTYTGITTIDSGAVLQLGDNVGDASIAGNVSDNGALVFDENNDLTYGGVISGTGSVTQTGPLTLTLTGINTFSGGLTIDRGTLSVAQDANLGAPTSTVSLGNGVLEVTASFTTGRDFALTGNGSIQTDAGTNLVISGTVSGDQSFSKAGAGMLTLTGANAWTSGMGIEDGILRATQSLPGNVGVGSSGTLDGVPGVGGNLSNEGTVAVHGGDTNVGGNYTNASTGTLAVSLGSKLAVTGTATLNGGTLEVTGADSGYVANTHTDVLTASGGVSGTFDQLVKDSGVVFTSTTIGYGPNDVYLDTTGLSITAAAAAMGIIEPAAVSAAQRVQTGFEAINATMASGGTPSSSLLDGAGAIQHSATPAVAQATLDSLSGQLHAASAAMLFDGIDASDNALFEHFDDLLSGRTRAGVWYGGLGWQGNLQRSGYTGATFRSSGGMAGADMRIGRHVLLGFAAGQSVGFGQLDAAWDHDRTWMNNVAVYGGLTNGMWHARAQIASGWYREDMQRLLQLGALAAPVGNGSTGRYVAGALEGGRLYRLGTARVEPFADVRYQRLDLGGFTEQGGLGYGLMADGHTAGRMQAGFGLRAMNDWRLANGMRMELDGSAGWQHTLRQYGCVFDASFTGFDNWLPVEGIGLSRNTATLRAGLSLWPTHDFGLRVGYMLEQGEREHAGGAMLQGAVTF